MSMAVLNLLYRQSHSLADDHLPGLVSPAHDEAGVAAAGGGREYIRNDVMQIMCLHRWLCRNEEMKRRMWVC